MTLELQKILHSERYSLPDIHNSAQLLYLKSSGYFGSIYISAAWARDGHTLPAPSEHTLSTSVIPRLHESKVVRLDRIFVFLTHRVGS